MKKGTRFVGLDVHAATIAVAVADAEGEVTSLGTIPNRSEAVAKLLKKLGPAEKLRVCYEAGPTGYVLYWQIVRLGIHCDVVAPTLVPVKAGDRVKTDRRDAERLARSYRSGDLTAVWVPDERHEGLRDLVRARECAKQDQLRARHRLGKFLLRHGRRAPEKCRAWGYRHMEWIRAHVHFEQAAQEAVLADYLSEVEHAQARIEQLERRIDEVVVQAPESIRRVVNGLQCLRGVAKVSAVTIACELGQVSRFHKARQLMGYSGLVSSERSSGERSSRGAITKTGNAHLRRVLVEAAWSYRFRPSVGGALRKRQEGQPEELKQIAWKAQHRLHKVHTRLSGRGKPGQQVVVAIARELVGFIWAIGIAVEQSRSAATRPTYRAA